MRRRGVRRRGPHVPYVPSVHTIHIHPLLSRQHRVFSCALNYLVSVVQARWTASPVVTTDVERTCLALRRAKVHILMGHQDMITDDMRAHPVATCAATVRRRCALVAVAVHHHSVAACRTNHGDRGGASLCGGAAPGKGGGRRRGGRRMVRQVAAGTPLCCAARGGGWLGGGAAAGQCQSIRVNYSSYWYL